MTARRRVGSHRGVPLYDALRVAEAKREIDRVAKTDSLPKLYAWALDRARSDELRLAAATKALAIRERARQRRGIMPSDKIDYLVMESVVTGLQCCEWHIIA